MGGDSRQAPLPNDRGSRGKKNRTARDKIDGDGNDMEQREIDGDDQEATTFFSMRWWFHAHVTGQQAEDLLIGQGQDSSFLCRPSQTNPGDFTLSVRRHTEVTHFKIQNTGDYYDLYGGEKFATLGELVGYYMENPGTLREKSGMVIELKNPLNCEEVTAERWYHSSLTGREAETLLLSKGQDGSFLVRASVHNPGYYALSWRVDEHVNHLLIRNKEGMFDMGGGGPTFSSVAQLLEHYKKNVMAEKSGEVILLKHPLHATSFLPGNIFQLVTELQKQNQQDVYGKNGFSEEFEQLQQQDFQHLYSCKEGARPENKSKNRYKNILPFDHTRVPIKDADPSVVGSDYINANYISGEIPGSERRYIATQGCLPATVLDFWKMIWQEDTRVIVMTTNEIERGKNKCTRYWPDAEDNKTYDKVHVLNLRETANPHYILREFLIHHEEEDSEGGRHIFHFHFKAWPDHGVPHDPGAVLGFLQDVNLRHSVLGTEGQESGPIVVHSSEGVGRTGTFIVVDILLNLICFQGWDNEIDVQKTIQFVRAQRSGMVQTEQQYRFVYMAIKHFVEAQQQALMNASENYSNVNYAGNSKSKAAAEPVYENVPKAKTVGKEAAKKLFDEAVEKGYVESRAIVLLLIGAAGAGKSHFKHLILRLPPPVVRESTPLVEAAIRAISVCRAAIVDGDMPWQLVSSEQFLRMVADTIKAGVPVRRLQPALFPVREHPHALDAVPTITTQPDASSQPSSNTQRSVRSAEKAPVLALDTPPSSPRSSSSSLESLDLSEPSETQLEVELMDLISQSSGSRKLFDVDWLYIVDSGGQPQFHEILPAFIRHASACVFITKLDECLTDHPTIAYYGKGGQRQGTPYRSLLTHEQILWHCFQALQSRQCTSSSPQSGPMVFVAGTHKDQEHHCSETRDAKNKKLLESLRPVFGDKLGLYRLAETDQLIFPVNAKTPGKEDKQVASEFRKMVTTSCPYEREKIPIQWLVLEQLLRQYATEMGESIVSVKQCRQIAQRLHMDDETFHVALDYLVALNIFHFYPSILPNVVFSDTQVLPDKISELVEYSHMLRGSTAGTSSVQSHSGGWLRFRDEGIITVEFLEEFPKHYVAGVFTPSDLLKLLSALLITAHLARNEYFMPSLLHELQPDELDHYRCDLTSFPSPLLVHYPGGWLPSGIFTSLIAFLQNVCSWKLLFRSGKPICLHRNCIKFRHPGGQPGSVTLIDSFTHFEVHLASPSPVSRVLCSEIHRAIFDGLEQAADTLSYTNLHPEEAIFCSAGGKDCEPTLHLAVVGADRRWWSCSTNSEVGGELTEGQTLWFSSAKEREAEKFKLQQPPNSPVLSKPTPKPRPKPPPKPKLLAVTDPTERVPSLAKEVKLHKPPILPKPHPKPRPKPNLLATADPAEMVPSLAKEVKPPILPKPRPRPHPKLLATADPAEMVPTLADKPKLYQLQCLQCRGRRVKIIETVAAKWEEVALALYFEGHTLQNIQRDTHIQCIGGCREMLQRWLDGEGRQPMTWETLMDALVGAGFVTVVEDLLEILRH